MLGTRELATRLSRAAVGKAKDDAILAMAHAYRSFAMARPGLYPATLRAPDPGDDERRASGEEVLARGACVTLLGLLTRPTPPSRSPIEAADAARAASF